jgi:hypothetical protein
MRNIMFALAISALAPLLASPASAQSRVDTGPWPVCLTAGPEGSTRCEFANVAQCLALAEGGLPGTCVINPAYRGNAYAQMRMQAY